MMFNLIVSPTEYKQMQMDNTLIVIYSRGCLVVVICCSGVEASEKLAAAVPVSSQTWSTCIMIIASLCDLIIALFQIAISV